MKDILDKVMDHVNKAFVGSELDYNDLHEIVLTGGSCRLPDLQNRIQEVYRATANINLTSNPEEAVVQGAAILGTFFDRDEKRALEESKSSSYIAFGLQAYDDQG